MMDTNTLAQEKKDILQRATTMTSKDINKEIDRRLKGIMTGYVKDKELTRLKSEAAALARLVLRRNGRKR